MHSGFIGRTVQQVFHMAITQIESIPEYQVEERPHIIPGEYS